MRKMQSVKSRLPLSGRWGVAVGSLTVAISLLVGSTALAAAPDLVVELRQTLDNPGPLFTKTTVSFTVDVHNEGDAAAAHVFVQTTLPASWSFAAPVDPDCFIGPAMAQFGFVSRGERALCKTDQILAGASKSFVLVARTPNVLTTRPIRGTILQSSSFTLMAAVDPDNVVQESNETNNSAALDTEVETKANLVSEWTAGPITPAVGSDHQYSARVRNTGDRDAPNVGVRIGFPRPSIIFDQVDGVGNLQCSPPTVDPASGDGLLSCSTGIIPAGGEATVNFTVHLNPQLSDGSFLQMTIRADPANVIPERNEFDKFAALGLTVRASADLQLSASLRTTFDWGPGVTSNIYNGYDLALLELHVKNAGPGRSSATALNLVWAQAFGNSDSVCPVGTHVDNDLIDCDDGVRDPTECFTSAPVPSLGPGESAEIQCFAIKAMFSLSPFVDFGSVTLDPLHVVRDPDRNNNKMSIPNHNADVVAGEPPH